jgi:hypothetical protein
MARKPRLAGLLLAAGLTLHPVGPASAEGAPDPFGQLDRVTTAPGQVTAAGWAIDPDTNAPIIVQLYLDRRESSLAWAGGSRPDVAAVYPDAGPGHGYSMTMDASPGRHSVCVFAINTGPGTSRLLGCRAVTVPGNNPIGNVERVSLAGGRVSASGWAIDPDTSKPIIVQMYVDYRHSLLTWARDVRADVGAVYPHSGSEHGFSMTMEVGPGAHTVCLFAINTGPGASTALGCRRVEDPLARLRAVGGLTGPVPASATGRLAVVPGSTGAPREARRTVRVRVEVEAGLPVDGAVFADLALNTLNGARGWGADGSVTFARTDGAADARIILASPRTVDALCAPLPTNGRTSCRNGDRVVINALRWAGGAAPFNAAGGTIAQYRDYVVNHEVGHILGRGHVFCPGSGRLAPVMQQQTLTMGGCRPNGWPYP